MIAVRTSPPNAIAPVFVNPSERPRTAGRLSFGKGEQPTQESILSGSTGRIPWNQLDRGVDVQPLTTDARQNLGSPCECWDELRQAETCVTPQ